MAFYLSVVLPFQAPASALQSQDESLHVPGTLRREPSSSSGNSVLLPRVGNYYVFADEAGILRHKLMRNSSTSEVTVAPPTAGAITIAADPARPGEAVIAMLTQSTPVDAPGHSTHAVPPPATFVDSPTETSNSSWSDTQSTSAIAEPPQKRRSLRLPNVFRRKSKRASASESLPVPATEPEPEMISEMEPEPSPHSRPQSRAQSTSSSQSKPCTRQRPRSQSNSRSRSRPRAQSSARSQCSQLGPRSKSNARERSKSRSLASSRNTSPLRKLFKSEPEEPATANGRIPYIPNPEAVEKLETRFVNPFRSSRSRRRRSSTGTLPCTALRRIQDTDP